VARRQPGLSIRMQSTTWSEVMDMWMKDQVAGPGVQDTHQTDLSADITRILCKFLSGFCGSLKEQGVEVFLMARTRSRNSEGRVKVRKK
jgi:hypothetical protein